jgi:RNA binding exosome subunit
MKVALKYPHKFFTTMVVTYTDGYAFHICVIKPRLDINGHDHHHENSSRVLKKMHNKLNSTQRHRIFDQTDEADDSKLELHLKNRCSPPSRHSFP